MTKEELEQCISEGLSSHKAAKKLCVSQTNVMYWARKHGLTFPGRRGGTPRVEHFCTNCADLITGKSKIYCSTKCQQAFLQTKRDARILESGCVTPHLKNAAAIKRFLIRVKPNGCEICNLTKWQGKPAPLVMDHIDGNSDNWKLDNLRLVCGNCDMQLPTYKSKNKGRGRHSRRQRYAEGKSY